MPALLTGTTRSAILSDTASRIVSASTSAGSRVYVSRSDVLDTADLPAVTLTLDRESDAVQIDGQTGLCTPYLDRSCDLIIGCHVTSTTDALVDTALNTLVEDVRAALLGDVAWAAGVYQIGSVATEYYIGTGEGGAHTGAAKITFGLSYSVQYG